MNKAAKRILIAIPVALVAAFALYLIVGVATYGYLTVSFRALKPGMTQAAVKKHLRGFTESVSRPVPCNKQWAKDHPYKTLRRYDLLGLKSMEMTITVAYDKHDRVAWTIDTFE